MIHVSEIIENPFQSLIGGWGDDEKRNFIAIMKKTEVNSLKFPCHMYLVATDRKFRIPEHIQFDNMVLSIKVYV